MQLTSTEINNAWRHWWAGHMAAVGGTSLLTLDPLEDISVDQPPDLLSVTTTNRHERRAQKRVTRQVRKPKPPRDAREEDITQSVEMADWAKNALGDWRNNDITLDDILAAADDYFEIFNNMKRHDEEVYGYFRKTGAPIVTNNTLVSQKFLDNTKLPNPDTLPQMFGAFVPRSRDEYREEIISDKGFFMDFEYFIKLRSKTLTSAPHGTTIYAHGGVSLNRNSFSKKELKKYPQARGTWGTSWLVGISPDGEVRALPSHMTRRQELPRHAGSIYHSGLMIPQGLYTLAGKNGPHKFVLSMFNVILAMSSSALAGVQVTVRKPTDYKGKGHGDAFRIGVPIGSIKTFFEDRNPTGAGRRRQILHLRRPHMRLLADGRKIPVGEHLRGERYFTWKGYEITLGIPGVHHPAIEAFTEAGNLDLTDDSTADTSRLLTLGELGDRMSRQVASKHKPQIRKGHPTLEFHNSPLAALQVDQN